MSIATYLTALDRDRDALAANLVTKGVQASSSETFTTLVPKVLDIPSGGGGGEIEWNTSTNCNSNLTQNASVTHIGIGVKKLTIENLNIGAQNSNNAAEAWAGFSNLEEVTLKNCNFVYLTTINYGLYFSSIKTPLLKKITLKNCTLKKAGTTYYPLNFSMNIPSGGTADLDIIIDGLTFETGITKTSGGIFNSCRRAKSITFNNIVLNDFVEFNYMFSSCSSLTSLDLSSFVATATKVSGMFNGCTSLATLDISGLDCTGITSSSNYTNMFNSVPTTCTIYVKDAANQAWFSSKFSGYTFTIKT